MRLTRWRDFDWLLLALVVVLTIVGVAMIYSATLGVESLAGTWRKQALYAVLGLAGLFLVATVDYHLLESFQWPIYFLTLLTLLFTLLFGRSDIGNVRRFIIIGGISVQPAFIALLLLIISLAGVLARRAPRPPGGLEFFLSLGMAGFAAFLVFKQPNLSTATLYAVTWAAMVFASGMNLLYLGGLTTLSAASVPLILPHLPQYMQDRIFNFLDPSRDPWAQYNLNQALISIGSGGLWGKGFGSGTQSQLHFLRVRHTDFIFSVICEELGFVGAAVILFIYLLLLWRLLRIAANAGDLTGRLIVVGVIAYIFYQLVINLGMNLSLLPVAGLPMPFISSGGSSLFVAYLGIGLVEGIAMHRRGLEFA